MRLSTKPSLARMAAETLLPFVSKSSFNNGICNNVWICNNGIRSNVRGVPFGHYRWVFSHHLFFFPPTFLKFSLILERAQNLCTLEKGKTKTFPACIALFFSLHFANFCYLLDLSPLSKPCLVREKERSSSNLVPF